MNFIGQINRITNEDQFFLPILSGVMPAAGFAPFTGEAFRVTVSGTLAPISPSVVPIISVSTTASTTDGSFAISSFPSIGPNGNLALSVSLNGQPLYRSERFLAGQLPPTYQIYLLQPSLPPGVGATAGQISAALAGHGLPGNTKLSTTAWGFGVVGSQFEVNIQFGLVVTPDTSHNLGVYFDLALNGYNIHVGWPASWCESAGDILNSIRAGLQSSGSAVNQLVESQLTQILTTTTTLTTSLVKRALAAVSVQFSSLVFPTPHTWALSNHSDPTVVLVPQLTIGYPRQFQELVLF